MEPPKVIREADPQEGRGCWMGCFGIGCLIIVVGFVALMVGGWYGFMHTRLPLVLIEQAIEEDGKVEIEGLTGSVSKGFHIDQLKFLTVDDEHWSELRGIKFDYEGLLSGRVVVQEMSVDSGTIYADVEGPEDFFFDPGDMDTVDDFKRNSDFSDFRVKLLQVNNLKIINLETDYSIEIEDASLEGFHATKEQGIIDLGNLTIKSNLLEVSTGPSGRWPDSPAAKRFSGNLRSAFSDRLKQDVDFAIDFDFDEGNERRAVSMFHDKWIQEFTVENRSTQLTDFSPDEYFTADHILPSHIQLVASMARSKTQPESDRSDNSKDSAESDNQWVIAPGAQFQLGKTTFQIESVEGNRAPLRAIKGQASIDGETIIAELRCRNYFQKGRIELKVDGQPADKTDWAKVIFGGDFDSLDRADQRQLEATIDASRADEDTDSGSKKSDKGGDKDADESPKAEKEDPPQSDGDSK